MNQYLRLQSLDLWQQSSLVTRPLYDVAAQLATRKHSRWAKQLRAAIMGITNNLAESSGSSSKVEFARFLGASHRSIFETANILIQIAGEVGLEDLELFLIELSDISRMVHAFRQSLL